MRVSFEGLSVNISQQLSILVLFEYGHCLFSRLVLPFRSIALAGEVSLLISCSVAAGQEQKILICS